MRKPLVFIHIAFCSKIAPVFSHHCWQLAFCPIRCHFKGHILPFVFFFFFFLLVTEKPPKTLS